jgi:hypothetical protein
VLASAGRLALNVFAAIERNPATHALAQALERHVDTGASVAKRAEHALADTDALRALVAGAGFRDITIGTAPRTVRFPAAADYVRIQPTGTPVAATFADHEPGERERLIAIITDDVGRSLAPYAGRDGLAFPQEMHTLLARRAP